jgi:hypothetical protein
MRRLLRDNGLSIAMFGLFFVIVSAQSVIWVRKISALTAFAGKRRADEQTRIADLISLQMIIHVLQGFVRACNYRISRGFSLLYLATCCALLRSRWCQSGVHRRQNSGAGDLTFSCGLSWSPPP